MTSQKARLIEEILASTCPHSILGTTPSSTPAQLRRAYLTRSRIVHPDKPPLHPSSTLAFQRLSSAYQTLTTAPPTPPSVSSILHDFLIGDFALIRRVLTAGGVKPHIIRSVEEAFVKMSRLVGEVRAYAGLIGVELKRIRRVQREVAGLGYLDLSGRGKGAWKLLRVTLAIPVRVDREVRRRRKRRVQGAEERGLLSEKIVRVLEFIVGKEVEDL